MSRSVETTLTCACGTTFAATIHQAVNVTLEPQLLYKLLAGRLNVFTCPNCGSEASSAQPFIYHDMKRGLFAYVSPNAAATDGDRERLLAQLREVYSQAVEASERFTKRTPGETSPRPTVRRRTAYDDLQAQIEPEAPPMQVIFGVDRLTALVESLLEPEERLGRVTLTTRGETTEERERLAGVARRMAEQMACQVAIDAEPDLYAVTLYGPRARTARIAQALNMPSR
ncbi:MAG: CpXC domain-containing protein [Ktedonobacterales bacterium]